MAESTQHVEMLQSLLDDHRLSRDVLDSMERAAAAERGGRSLSLEFWQQAIGYFDGYFDLVHHRVEDGLLLPRLAREGLAGSGSAVRQMIQEHDRMRPFRQHLRHALELRSATDLHATSQVFVSLLRQHLTLEEHQVFPLVRTVLGADVRSELATALERHSTDHAAARRSVVSLVESITHRAGAREHDSAV